MILRTPLSFILIPPFFPFSIRSSVSFSLPLFNSHSCYRIYHAFIHVLIFYIFALLLFFLLLTLFLYCTFFSFFFFIRVPSSPLSLFFMLSFSKTCLFRTSLSHINVQHPTFSRHIFLSALIKNIRISSYIRKFIRVWVQSHI